MSEIINIILTYIVPSVIAGVALVLSTRKNKDSLLSEEEEETIGSDGSRHIKKKKMYK